jgi:hypothetical protein
MFATLSGKAGSKADFGERFKAKPYRSLLHLPARRFFFSCVQGI